MDRRRFIASAAALGAMSAIGARAPVYAGMRRARRVRYQKALKIGMISGGETLAEKFAIASKAGFAGVELDSPSGLAADEVIDARNQTGMAVPGVVDSVHWAKPLNHPDEAVREEGLAGLERAIRDCAAWTTPASVEDPDRTVLLVPAVVSADMPYADARRLSIEGIATVLPLARKLGIKIAIENVWNGFLLSPLEAAAYVDELNDLAGARTCGWYFDVGNIWRLGWPAHWIDALDDRIFRLDIKGYSRTKADKEGRWAGFGVEIDEGDLDWGAVRTALMRIGYTGWATAEVRGGDLTRLEDISARMGRVLGTG
ncbi:MAG: xylose isomerase [Phycisphaeraceae bacterium]|nr:MAG: xylose isomerase [Phycisphaeraceae bacterium]